MARWLLKPVIRKYGGGGGGFGGLGAAGLTGGGFGAGILFGGGYGAYRAAVSTGLLGGAEAGLGLASYLSGIFGAFAGFGGGYGGGGYGGGYGGGGGGGISFDIGIETDLAKFFGDLRAEILKAFRRAVRAASVDLAEALEYGLVVRCPRDTGKLVHSIRCRAEGVKGAVANTRRLVGGGGGRASTRVRLGSQTDTLASIRVTMEYYGFILNAEGRHRAWIDRVVAHEITVQKFADAVRKHYRRRTADLGLPGR